ncbi:energy-coupling factor ABC transporter ATP-binding protein [Nocardioides sp. zg-1228]|uniref:energy-coupling factor ABC transporter ATP-binding protein n=1 Tax=Nocardioides sp. zg-1228 TaxID=2763008 RepID=UPI0016436A9D|nr:ABC transporter ATP-binding protein [Nocardioides sp. zg-1228]MBC2933300.1 ABC transporter ATP-binding protein [Nocardioides sp. zg-1228]QSF56540.1 ABC transporter ATP-binding protein [Nocardioides sp. zg-1228]
MATIHFDRAGARVPLPGRGEREILAPTTLVLTERRVAVIGANGSGKSTLARMVNGLVRPTTGRVTVDGRDVAREGAAVRRRVGFCFTDPAAQLVMPTCVEDVELSLRRTIKDAGARRERAMAVLAANGLEAHAHDSVHSLSGGQRQLLALAGVLALEPAVVVADEPTTLLDRANTRRVGDALLALDQQLLLVTHDLDLAARCDRVLVVDAARVVADGAPREAIAHYTGLVDA